MKLGFRNQHSSPLSSYINSHFYLDLVFDCKFVTTYNFCYLLFYEKRTKTLQIKSLSKNKLFWNKFERITTLIFF